MFDVIILTECHLGTCPLIRSLPNYRHYGSSQINNQAGGVVAYVRADWNATVSEPALCNADSILVELPNSKSILGIYRSPSFGNINQFLLSLDSIVKGDLNINTLNNYCQHPQADEYLCFVAQLGLQNLINVPTRGPSCLDHILADFQSQAVGLVCKVDNFHWEDLLEGSDVSVAACNLSSRLKVLVEKHSKHVSVSRRKTKLKDWITPGLIRNTFSALLKNIRKDHNKRELLESRDQPSRMWKTIKNICELNKNKEVNLELTKFKTCPSQSLDMCNDYFVNVGQNLANNILSTLGKTEVDLAAKVTINANASNSLFMTPTDPVEILGIIQNLRNNSAPGLDEEGLSLVATWLNSNLLTLNADKTKYLCFHITKVSSPPVSLNIKIHKCGNSRTSQKPNCSCNMIDRADYIKYLGVVLDENLTFGQHIKTLSGRVRKLIHIMKLLRDGADRGVLKMVYTSLCQSVICYCLT
ncbi:Uncharacterized protein OBRU01_19381, partial [Operophtera brumata]